MDNMLKSCIGSLFVKNLEEIEDNITKKILTQIEKYDKDMKLRQTKINQFLDCITVILTFMFVVLMIVLVFVIVGSS